MIDIAAIVGDGYNDLPITLRLLVENFARTSGESDAHARSTIAKWLDRVASSGEASDFAIEPCRLMMHDTTCTPALVDLVDLFESRDEISGQRVPLSTALEVDVSVDHSLAVHAFGDAAAAAANLRRERERNAERYAFLRWAESTIAGLRLHRPGTGIMHTINIEQLADVVLAPTEPDDVLRPELMLGTDSHTPMVNGLGVLAWGIGGLEALSTMLGEAVQLSRPEVVGIRLTGELRAGVLVTDLALTLTATLRSAGVTGSFLEFCGPGVSTLRAEERCVVANMAPEYGAATALFPVDAETVGYLERLGRSTDTCARIEPTLRALGIWFDPQATPAFDRIVDVDLTAIERSVAGPRRPQDRLATSEVPAAIERAIDRRLNSVGGDQVPDAMVAVAAITSCTNTSDPRLLIAAGLLARSAVAHGLVTPPWVKTSLAPGSPSTRSLLERAGLLEPLDALGFSIVGYGCTTCIGNSGDLLPSADTALAAGQAVAAVLSGNRNFPGRVHPSLDLALLASPPLVVAYALAGGLVVDIATARLGYQASGEPVTLDDLWPNADEIDAVLAATANPLAVRAEFTRAAHEPGWDAIEFPRGDRYPWDPNSLTLRRPHVAQLPAVDWTEQIETVPLVVLGDDMTTDHISPAGQIDIESAAAHWLGARGAHKSEVNVYASYRGNHEVMRRGAFANAGAQNMLAPAAPPGHSVHHPSGEVAPVWHVGERYREAGQWTVIIAGDRYGMGSSRDWAAKNARWLGAAAVLATGIERIHRSNLVRAGVLPVVIDADTYHAIARVQPHDRIVLSVDELRPTAPVKIALSFSPITHWGTAALDTRREAEVLRAGGVVRDYLHRHAVTDEAATSSL